MSVVMSRVFFFCLLIAGHLCGQALSVPSREVRVEQVQGTSVPKWEHGHLVWWDLNTATVFAANGSGRVSLQCRIWPERSSTVHIMDLSASPEGGFAVAFTALNNAGAPAGFIAWLEETGKTGKLVQLDSAGAFKISFAKDGSLWALVRQHDEFYNDATGYDMLRHYDQNGTLVGTALPRKIFTRKQYPDGPHASLSVSRDRIGVYIAPSRTWVELSLSGEILGHWSLPDKKAEFTRVFLSESNNIYISTQERPNPKEMAVEFGLYKFDRTSGSIVPINVSAAEGEDIGKLRVRGVDGDQLVVSRSSSSPMLKWVSVEFRQ